MIELFVFKNMAKKTVKSSNIFAKLLSFLVLLIPVLIVLGVFSKVLQNRKNYVNPRDFSTNITNKYFSLPVGKKFIYEESTEEGLERKEVSATGETNNVMGVETLVLYDKVYLNGKLKEDTKDYIAQYKNGDVWYFGEDVDNYDNKGNFANHSGAWIAGVNGANPGILIKQNPKIGETYQQEFYPNEAEDRITVMATDETVVTKLKTYEGCLKTYDWSPLDPTSVDNKYYCPEVATIVSEVDLLNGDRSELLEIQ
jgi:hypothetical protein